MSEALDLKWNQTNLAQGKLHVNRLKNGEPSVHYLEGDEIRALRKLRRSYPESPYIFPSERQGPLSASAVCKIVARAGVEAELTLSVHPHMLRHYPESKTMPSKSGKRSKNWSLVRENVRHSFLRALMQPLARIGA